MSALPRAPFHASIAPDFPDDEPIVLKFPTIYIPEDEPSEPFANPPTAHTTLSLPAHTTTSRVRTPQGEPKSKPLRGKRQKHAETSRDLFGRVEGKALAVAQDFAAHFARPALNRDRAAQLAAETTLPVYWRDWMKSDQLKVCKKNTIGNYAAALSLWERFAPRPDSGEWAGMPIGLIETGYVEAFCTAAQRGHSVEYIRSVWKQLRVMFNHAKNAGVISNVPRPRLPAETDDEVTIFEDTSDHSQLEPAYRSLSGSIDLQVAFVLAINAGPRPRDLFLLSWDQFKFGPTPRLKYTSTKTGKVQCVPLAPITVKHLMRLPGWGKRVGPLFPGRSNPTSDDPERSRQARRRNEQLKAAFASVGLHIEKPFQVARATCNTRLNSTYYGVGDFVLGHALNVNGVNAKHYFRPTQIVVETVNRVPQPSCFLEIP